jgi:hypothetical protein
MKTATVAGLILWLGLASAGQPEGTAGTSYGGGVTLEETTALSALLAAPQDHVDRIVRIDGVATEVCREHGDWLKISVPRAGSGLLVALGKGFSVPSDIVGRRVTVQGVLVAEPRDTEPRDEPGRPADEPRICPAMTRGGMSYHLDGSGVAIY